jgi:hypothetical protein
MQTGRGLHRPGEIVVFLSVARYQDQRGISRQARHVGTPIIFGELADFLHQPGAVESEWKSDERLMKTHVLYSRLAAPIIA